MKRRDFLKLTALTSMATVMVPPKGRGASVTPPRVVALGPHTIQREFIEFPGVRKVFVGGWASGKTTGGALNVMHWARDGERWLVLAPTYSMLRCSTLPTFCEVAGRAEMLADFYKASLTVVLRSGAIVQFASAESMGRRPFDLFIFHGVWLDEPAVMHNKIASWLSHQAKATRISMTFSPVGKPELNKKTGKMVPHWTERITRRWRRFHCPTTANPFLPREYIQAVQDAMEKKR